MAGPSALCSALGLCSILSLWALPARAAQRQEDTLYMWIDAHQARVLIAQRQEDTLYMWIDAHQARVLIGFEEDILIVSEGKMAPFTHDFRKAQQRMPAIPVNIHSMNFTWQATGRAEYFYEFLSLRSLDKGIMADPTINIPLLGTVPHKASVVQVGFPCLGKQDGVAAFEVTVIIMNSEGNVILQTPQNAIFFKTCQQGKCQQPCRNGGKCTGKNKCKCSKGYQGDLCSKPLAAFQGIKDSELRRRGVGISARHLYANFRTQPKYSDRNENGMLIENVRSAMPIPINCIIGYRKAFNKPRAAEFVHGL
ncbi:Wnt inhibitory factor 1 [Chelonia mydas]|uniref:Wnt inhibitory factor 1 n=1 Tax=Chelonia mydas TaxID=8469 RepID=M7BDV9_CHEMY|nr:Wnt inhibitory factor 1 [Chelonia mydas]